MDAALAEVKLGPDTVQAAPLPAHTTLLARVC